MELFSKRGLRTCATPYLADSVRRRARQPGNILGVRMTLLSHFHVNTRRAVCGIFLQKNGHTTYWLSFASLPRRAVEKVKRKEARARCCNR